MQRADFATSRDPANTGYYAMNKGWAQIAAEDRAQGCETMKTASHNFIQTPALRAMCAVRQSDPAEAKLQVRAAVALFPTFTAKHWRTLTMHPDPAVIDRQVADLTRAGFAAK